MTLGDGGAFAGLPAEVDAGTSISVRNTSTAQVHEMLTFPLPQSEHRSAGELVRLPRDEFEALLGSATPDVVLAAWPGAGGEPGFGDDTFDTPGRHLVVCLVPEGSDPEALRASDRYLTGRWPDQYADIASHAMSGEYAEVIVRDPKR